MTRLPPTFTSLYRLFLRTTSAAVLHHSSAARTLRKLWRPAFQTASLAIERLNDDDVGLDEQQKIKNWLEIWEHRMDNTLRLLYNSAISHGLPHDLTRNLSFLLFGHAEWWRKRHFTPASVPWNPQQRPESPITLSPRSRNKAEKQRRWRELDDRGWGALEEVVKMAEGRHQISLGRIVVKKPSYRNRR